MTTSSLDATLFSLLDVQDVYDAIQALPRQLSTEPSTLERLTTLALENAETNPRAASHWLSIGEALYHRGDFPRSLQAQMIYTQARICLLRGELSQAEAQIATAQNLWRSNGGGLPLARSFLGLTQVLALQGRYIEAETAIQEALTQLPPQSVLAAQARLNWANLLRRQERHRDALAQYEAARDILGQHLAEATDSQTAAPFQTRLAHVALNQANALMSLDLPERAEAALRTALERFAQLEDSLNVGRTYTNLGSLYLRMGRYDEALVALQAASKALDTAAEPPSGQVASHWPEQQTDILYLEQARAYLALNLIPEAVSELEKATQLFAAAGKPFEWGQSFYTLGLVHLNNSEPGLARENLQQASQLFGELTNALWQNRVELALASLDYREGCLARAMERTDRLLARLEQERPTSAEPANTDYHNWDVSLRVELLLLRLRLHLEAGEPALAQARADAILGLLHADEHNGDSGELYPHLRLRYCHSLGCIARASGQIDAALEQFRSAVALLESQRVRLPLEEFKTAFLSDKSELYGDLFECLLHKYRSTSQSSPGEAGRWLREAFAVSEQARSRALLDRLDPLGQAASVPAPDTRSQQLRQQVHWLYNQLLSGGEGTDGSNSPAASGDWQEKRRELRRQETALQKLGWDRSELAAQALPVGLAAFQQTLAPDQQAVVYFTRQVSFPGGQSPADELFAFVVSRDDYQFVCGLGTGATLQRVAGLLRFQMGRAELGFGHLQKHRSHLLQNLNAALHELYRLIFQPLESHLSAPRLLLIPHGQLHQMPLHCLWDGDRYLIERFEIGFMPSASLAVHSAGGPGEIAVDTWAGLALEGSGLRHTKEEILRAAAHFPNAHCFLGFEANRAGLVQAAASADVLHLATHGLFRPDNPFFSSLKLADGWVDVHEIYRLAMRAQLVVLSACESGAGHVQGGDEVVGLARGFLGAGARFLLVSLWNVHDESAVAFSDDFYAELLDTGSPATALRNTQISWIKEMAHPYFWAPFVLIG